MAPIKTPRGDVQRIYRGGRWVSRAYRGSKLLFEENLEPQLVDATVASTTGANISSTGAQQVARPAGVEPGDLLLFILSSSSSTDGPSTAPAGFTTIVYNEYSATGFRTMVAYKRATASEPSTYTFHRGGGAAARVDMTRITGAHETLAPTVAWNVVAGTTSTTGQTFPGVAATPPSGSDRNLALAIVSRPGAGGATENMTWSVSGWTKVHDAHSWAWTSQALFWRRHDSTAATAVPTYVLSGTDIANRYSTFFTVVIPSGVRVPQPPTSSTGYTPSPTLPSGNLASKTNLRGATYTDPQGRSSLYHRWANHLQGDGPYPLVIHLHGDGAYEYNNPDTWTSPQYMRVAQDINGVGLIPRTPEPVPAGSTNYQVTWWKRYEDTQWLVNFIYMQMEVWNIDRKRIYISGFSGGAVVTTLNLVADYPEIFHGGGAMMLGGGSTPTSWVEPTPPLQQQFPMRWHVGEVDDGRNTLDNYNARAAAESSEARYRANGWDTRITLIPGADHLGSESRGPAALRSLVEESYAKYGLTI